MKGSEIQKHEIKRLREMENYHLVGFAGGEDYDLITSMASTICGTKIAFISLIMENKQLLLSNYGLGIQEASKDYSFCSQAIYAPNEPLVVEDFRKNDPFQDTLPIIGNTEIASYAGFPLITHQGYVLGLLCTIDDIPREFSKSNLKTLKKLARQVMNYFESRKKNITLEILNDKLNNKVKHLRNIQHANQIGLWEMDIASGAMTWSDLIYELHEVPKSVKITTQSTLEFYHPKYRSLISKAITQCCENGNPSNLISQIVTAKDNLIWVQITIMKDGDKLKGSFQDITDIKKSELRYTSIIEGTNIGTWEWNVQTGKTVYNERWAEILGYTLAELAPVSIDTWINLAHPDDLEESNRRLNACFEKETSHYEFEARMKHKDGRWIWVYDRGKIFEWTKDGRALMMYGTHQDITERKQKEERLSISEEAFRGNFENAAIGMALLDENGKWLKVNSKVCEIVGYTQEELIKLTFQDITHPDDLDTDMALLQELINGKRDHYQMDKRYFHKDGHIVYILLAVSIVKNQAGKVLYFISQIIDISESKKLLSNITYQRELLSTLYKLSPIGIALNDYETGKFIDVNDKLLEPTGYSREEFLSLSYWDTTPKKYEPLEVLAIQQMEREDSYDLFEKEYIRKDGSRYPIALQGIVIIDSNGKKLIWSFVRDISSEKEHEKKLQEAISSLQAILNASKQVSIIATDKSGAITMFNSGAEKLLGYKAFEVIGENYLELIHRNAEINREGKVLSQKLKKGMKGSETFIYEINGGMPSTKEWTYIRKDRTSFPVLLSMDTITDKKDIVGYLQVATDISELKKVEKEIKSLLDITNEQNERLRNFAHIVSHNLRSHSGGISGILDLMRMEYPDISQSEIFEYLNKGTENLNQTVNDLTEIVEVHLIQSDISEVYIHEVIQKNIDSLKIQINDAKIKIITTIDHDLKVKAVPAYLDSIVLNMITNAIKYRDEKKLCYLKIYSGKEESMISLYFEDNGLGIDLKIYGDKLFGMYKTFHEHNDSRGVGLFITKNQVESMGGKIQVESKVNRGTTFKILLPL
tara:strand:- start:1095 stop:4229 length:3135 start_codon:yes stop_codon:yes gene_type:complete